MEPWRIVARGRRRSFIPGVRVFTGNLSLVIFLVLQLVVGHLCSSLPPELPICVLQGGLQLVLRWRSRDGCSKKPKKSSSYITNDQSLVHIDLAS